jgi:hypothetical protein
MPVKSARRLPAVATAWVPTEIVASAVMGRSQFQAERLDYL